MISSWSAHSPQNSKWNFVVVGHVFLLDLVIVNMKINIAFFYCGYRYKFILHLQIDSLM